MESLRGRVVLDLETAEAEQMQAVMEAWVEVAKQLRKLNNMYLPYPYLLLSLTLFGP